MIWIELVIKKQIYKKNRINHPYNENKNVPLKIKTNFRIKNGVWF